jgi:hypothetical protein
MGNFRFSSKLLRCRSIRKYIQKIDIKHCRFIDHWRRLKLWVIMLNNLWVFSQQTIILIVGVSIVNMLHYRIKRLKVQKLSFYPFRPLLLFFVLLFDILYVFRYFWQLALGSSGPSERRVSKMAASVTSSFPVRFETFYGGVSVLPPIAHSDFPLLFKFEFVPLRPTTFESKPCDR